MLHLCQEARGRSAIRGYPEVNLHFWGTGCVPNSLPTMTVEELWDEALSCLHRAAHGCDVAEAALMRTRAAKLISVADSSDGGATLLTGCMPTLLAA